MSDMTAPVESVARPTARFVVLYDTPSDVEAFERHYNDVHLPLARRYPGLRRLTRSHQPTVVIGEPCYLVVMMDWDDMAALEAALGSEAGQRAAADAIGNLTRYTAFRGLILHLDEAADAPRD